MQIVIPSGQTLSKAEASVALSHQEATELRDALDAMLTTGVSSWHVDTSWEQQRTDVTVNLMMLAPDGHPASR